MTDVNTFAISRIRLRKLLLDFKVNERSATELIAEIEKNHRHINAIAFAADLEKAGLRRETVEKLLRRIGMDGITIQNTLDIVDENKIAAETRKIFRVEVEFI